VDLTMGSKTVPTSFFIISSKSTYTVLLGRDWINANYCIPSTMHQCLIHWDGDEVEVVHADDLIEISLAAMSVWDAELALNRPTHTSHHCCPTSSQGE
jgi:hypothetical protein